MEIARPTQGRGIGTWLLWIVTVISPLVVQSAEMEWLPAGTIFPYRYLDPTACQNGISLLSYEVEGESQQLLYVPVSLSMRQQFIQAYHADRPKWEIGMEFSIFSQFSVVDVGEVFMGGLQNADYRIGAAYHYQHQPTVYYRLGLFHQSSHLGDDYIIRNFIDSATLRTLNYEQLDFTYLRTYGVWAIYGLLGYNVSPHTVRKRLLLQGGGDWRASFSKVSGLAWVGGMDMKVYEHNDYRPNIRFGWGVELAREELPLMKLLLTYYQGHLPYSTLEYQQVRLAGLSLIFHLSN